MSFESSLNATQSLLTKIEAGNYDRQQAQTEIAELVQTVPGARGFFVVLLSQESEIEIHLDKTVIEALKSSPEIVAQLLTKNLAMSTAMSILHQGNGDAENLSGSLQVQKRVQELIEQLKSTSLNEELQQLQKTLEIGEGSYQDFLARFNYDSQQKAAILKVLKSI